VGRKAAATRYVPASGVEGAGFGDRDRALGMDRKITRRDFLDGCAVAGAGALAGPLLAAAARAAQSTAGAGRPDPAGTPAPALPDYPPTWTGLRGSNDAAYAAAHATRDGAVWGEPADTGEAYDLVVVGAGISGLAAAHFYRAQTAPGARILLLDNHDDFGGHARRNEFHLGGRLHLLNGGSAEIDSPRPYSAVADGLLRALGLDVAGLIRKAPSPEFFRANPAERGVFLDRETFGADKLVAGRGGRTWVHCLDDAPLSPAARADIVRLELGEEDYLPGKSSAQKKALLSSISYRDFLRDCARADPQVLAFYAAKTNGNFAVGIDAVSALDYWASEGGRVAGMQGLRLAPGATERMGYTPAGYASTGGSYHYHFPDGNATIARLLVRDLIPEAAPAGSVEKLVTARFDYAVLDRPGAAVRLRLDSTAVRARNDGEGVAVDYVRGGQPFRVRARRCVLACYNMIIPYLCPELPDAQKSALHELVKSPLLSTSVAIRHARAFHALGLRQIEAPGIYHPDVLLNPHMAIGDYRGPRTPDEPTLVFMQRTPCQPGLSEREQNRAGRAELLATSFETIERNVRDQLGRMLGPAGFDPAQDITGIMVNRWAHGYAPEFNSLFDPVLPLAEQPHIIGRARFGRIAIANSDSGRAAYTDIAIDQAHRAVQELLAHAAA